jgi:hypothetical protein
MLRLAATFFTAAGFAACSEGVSQNTSATILSIDGTCSVRFASTRSAVSLSRDLHPARGDSIETSSGGRVAAALLPNLLIDLAPATTLRIVDLSLTKDGNETGDAMRRRVGRANLIRGRIFVSQERRDVAAEPQLTITTTHGQATSNFDCVFALETSEQRTRMTCSSGWCYFAPARGGESVRVEPGYVIDCGEGASPKTFAAETDAEAQATLGEIRVTGQKLVQLRDAQPDAAPPWKVARRR